MKILLVKPSISQRILGRYRLNDGPMEPLSLAVLASLIPEEHEVVLADDRLKPVSPGNGFDLVAITTDTWSASRAYQLADGFRAQGAKVVLGGIHASLLPDEAGVHADAVLVGDAEEVWPQVIEDLSRGTLQAVYKGSPHIPQQGGLIPRRNLFEGKNYLPISLVQFSRGCLFDCHFCSVSRFFDRRLVHRPVADVVRELEGLPRRTVLFVDDNLTLDRARAKELCRAIRPLKLRWAAQTGIDMVEDKELLELMAESGCVGQLIGFESIVADSLRWLNKSRHVRGFDRYQRVLERLRRHGLQTWASFIIGNDHDTPESIRETVEFAIQSRFTLAFFHLLMPYPGTRLYEGLASEGRLLYDGRWWLHPDFGYNTAAFVPRHMSPEELGHLATEANKKFYSVSSITRRLFDPATNLRTPYRFGFYLRFNALLRSTST